MKSSSRPQSRQTSATARRRSRVALRVEHHHHVAAADVLRHRDLERPRLADARGAEHQRVAAAVGHRDRHVALGELDPVQGRVAADVGLGAEGIEGGVPAQETRDRPVRPHILARPDPAHDGARLDEAPEARLLRVGVALRVPGGPLEAAAEEEAALGDRHLGVVHRPLPAAAQVAPVAHDAPAAPAPPEPVDREQRARRVGHVRGHHERRRRQNQERAAEPAHQAHGQLHGRAQERLHGVFSEHPAAPTGPARARCRRAPARAPAAAPRPRSGRRG